MANINKIIIFGCLFTLVSCGEQAKKVETKEPVKKLPTEAKSVGAKSSKDLKTDSSFGLGYGLAFPYLGYGGIGTIDKGPIGHAGYAKAPPIYENAPGQGAYRLGGKSIVIPVYNYGIGGLGQGTYALGNPTAYGYTNLLLGGHYGYPWAPYYKGYGGRGGPGMYGELGAYAGLVPIPGLALGDYGGYGGYGGHGGYGGYGGYGGQGGYGRHGGFGGYGGYGGQGGFGGYGGYGGQGGFGGYGGYGGHGTFGGYRKYR